MRCRECSSCKLGFFKSKPDKYVCTGVKEPFVIEDINVHCTEYKYLASTTREDAIRYINSQLTSGYLDLGMHDEYELQIVKAAMEALDLVTRWRINYGKYS